MRLSVVIPEREIFSGEVLEVILPGASGGLGVLPHHAALLTTLKAGPLRYKTATGETAIELLGGFAEVTPSSVQVLADGVKE